MESIVGKVFDNSQNQQINQKLSVSKNWKMSRYEILAIPKKFPIAGINYGQDQIDQDTCQHRDLLCHQWKLVLCKTL